MKADNESRGWVTRSLLPEGEEPDPRFTLANERTFLSWIRTSLAFLAGGLALEGFAPQFIDPALRMLISLLLIGVGILLGCGAAGRWLRVERHLRRRRPLPAPLMIPLLSIGAVVLVILIVLVAAEGR